MESEGSTTRNQVESAPRQLPSRGEVKGCLQNFAGAEKKRGGGGSKKPLRGATRVHRTVRARSSKSASQQSAAADASDPDPAKSATVRAPGSKKQGEGGGGGGRRRKPGTCCHQTGSRQAAGARGPDHPVRRV